MAEIIFLPSFEKSFSKKILLRIFKKEKKIFFVLEFFVKVFLKFFPNNHQLPLNMANILKLPIELIERVCIHCRYAIDPKDGGKQRKILLQAQSDIAVIPYLHNYLLIY